MILTTFSANRLYQLLPRDALQCKARFGDRMSYAHPSVYDVGGLWSHRWNSSKIISRLVNVGCSLSEDPNIVDLLQWEQLEI